MRLLEPRKRSENTLRNLTVDLFVKQSELDDRLQALFTQLGQEGKGFDLLVEGESSASLGNTALVDLGSAPALTSPRSTPPYHNVNNPHVVRREGRPHLVQAAPI